jgi:AmiR/NasT family two-component response regulator
MFRGDMSDQFDVHFNPLLLQAEGLLVVARRITTHEALEWMIDTADARDMPLDDVAQAVVDREPWTLI